MQPVVVSAPPPPPTPLPPADVPRKPGRKWTIVDASYYGIRGAGGIRPARVSQHNDTRIHTQYGTHSHGHVCACTHSYMCTQYIHSHTRVRHCCYCLLSLYYGYADTYVCYFRSNGAVKEPLRRELN